MSNIIKFPGGGAPEPAAAPPAAGEAKPKGGFNAKGKAVLAGVWRAVWIVFVLIWPVLKWVLAIITFFQFVRMLYHWNTPGVYAGWSFLAYFAALTAITYFVSIYKPKGL